MNRGKSGWLDCGIDSKSTTTPDWCCDVGIFVELTSRGARAQLGWRAFAPSAGDPFFAVVIVHHGHDRQLDAVLCIQGSPSFGS